MLESIDRTWRLLTTGLSFLVFGVGGIVLWAIGIPLLFLFFPLRERRQKAARRLVHGLFWMFVRLMRLMGVLRFDMIEAGRLDRQGLVIVANHPTLLDVVFLLSMVPEATCIVRAGLSSNPFTRAAVRSAGYVCNDWGVELVDACVQALHGGSSLIVFPEGTRTSSQPRKWHRGAANIALRTGKSLTPVVIVCEPPSLRKGEPWWHIPHRRMHYSIRVLDDMPVGSESSRWENDVQAARGLTRQLQELLTERVEPHAGA